MSIRWSYAVARADGSMKMLYSEGPLADEVIVDTVGRPYEVIQLRDSTAIACREQTVARSLGLKPNGHYQFGIYGDVIVGKLDSQGRFVGAIGVEVQER